MAEGLEIIGDKVKFTKWGFGQIYYSCITRSFEIKIQDIKIIAISPRLALDEEMLMISLIDKKGKLYKFSNFEFGKDSMKEIERRFLLKDIKVMEWDKFSWEDHENYITDKIIYPKELYWEDLYLRPKGIFKSIVQWLKFLSIKKSIGGKFTNKVQNYINGK